MKKIVLTLAAVLCCVMTTNVVNAQTTETESKSDRYFRLSKMADENPSDWKAQLEVGHILLDKESDFYNQTRACRYYERIYHLAADYNKEIPDSVFAETCEILIAQAINKSDLDELLFYSDEMLRAEKIGRTISNETLIAQGAMASLYAMAKEDNPRALMYMSDARKRVAESQKPGIECTDVMTAMLYDNLFSEYKKLFGDKLIELTIDAKKYIIIAIRDWNVEKPLMGWFGSLADKKAADGKLFLVYDEDGQVHDDVRGSLDYTFECGKDGLKSKEGASRLITVTPEQREKMIKAYHNYMKKEKKE
jgi:hypothetical protein